MKRLRDFPIQRKLTLIVLASSVVALVLACAAFVTYEQLAFRRTMTRDLSLLAQMLGASSAAPLSFGDNSSAEQMLNGLRAQPHIVAAAIYDNEGGIFVTYRRDPNAYVRWLDVQDDSERIDGEALHLFRRIELAGEKIGTVYLQSDLVEARTRLQRYAAIVAGVLLAAILAAYLTGSRLQRIVSEPISQLSAAAARVASGKDYSARAIKRGDDELGRLIDVFNDMLGQIQTREIDLERRVEERTRQLQSEIAVRAQTEAKLANSLSVLQATLEAAVDGILVVNREGRLVDFNRKFVEMWGIPADILAQRDDAKTIAVVLGHLKDPDAFVRRVEELYAHPDLESFDVLEFKDGRVFERFSHPQRIAGATVGRVWCFRDVTEQRHARQRLILLAAALDAAPNSVVITAADGAIEWINPAFARVTGYRLEEIVGLNPRILNAGQQPREYYAEMWRTITSGRHWHGEFINKRKDGTLFSEEATIAPVRDADGTIRHFVAITLDVTVRKTLETQLRQAQKMEMVGQLAGGVAHDFNNILTAMMLNLELLSKSGLPPKAAAQLQDVRTMTQRGARLTEQLLLFARQHVMRTDPLELNAVLANILKMLRRILGEHLTVTLVSNAQQLWIEADAGMIDQVVMNLCVNARDAMPSGGRLTLEARRVEITAGQTRLSGEARPGNFACLRVSDTGCGMPPEVLARAFEPFFTTKEIGKGTGLGLATVHGIVHQHHGWIEVESTVGIGTTFQIFLPLSAPPLRVEKPAPPEPIQGGSETILFVEDEELVRRATADMLRRLGYRVLVAAHGAEALTLWQKHASDIDLLFTDMVMPNGVSGLDLTQRLRQSAPDLKVIVVSGYSPEIGQSETLRTPGTFFLSKPFEFGALAHTIRTALGRT